MDLFCFIAAYEAGVLGDEDCIILLQRCVALTNGLAESLPLQAGDPQPLDRG